MATEQKITIIDEAVLLSKAVWDEVCKLELPLHFHVHRKLWESGVYKQLDKMFSVNLLWLTMGITTEAEFIEINIGRFSEEEEIEARMFCCFAALMFGGDLEV